MILCVQCRRAYAKVPLGFACESCAGKVWMFELAAAPAGVPIDLTTDDNRKPSTRLSR